MSAERPWGRVYTGTHGHERAPSLSGAMNGEPTGRVRFHPAGGTVYRYVSCADPQELLDALTWSGLHWVQCDDGTMLNTKFAVEANAVPLEAAVLVAA